MLQHQVLPFLQDRRRAVPEDRVLKDDYVMVGEKLLLPLHIDIELGILLVEIVKGHPGKLPHMIRENPVDVGFLQRRMGKQNQNSRHGIPKLGRMFDFWDIVAFANNTYRDNEEDEGWPSKLLNKNPKLAERVFEAMHGDNVVYEQIGNDWSEGKLSRLEFDSSDEKINKTIYTRRWYV